MRGGADSTRTRRTKRKEGEEAASGSPIVVVAWRLAPADGLRRLSSVRWPSLPLRRSLGGRALLLVGMRLLSVPALDPDSDDAPSAPISRSSSSDRLKSMATTDCWWRLCCLTLVSVAAALTLLFFLLMTPTTTPSSPPAVIAPHTPTVCTHRMSPFPVGGSGRLSHFAAFSQFVAQGVRCFDLDLSVASDGVVFLGRPEAILFALDLNSTTTSSADELEAIDSKRIREADTTHIAPTLTEFFNFLEQAPFEVKPTAPAAGPPMVTAASIGSGVSASSSPPVVVEAPPRAPIFVTLEPKPLQLRTQARLEAMMRLLLARPKLLGQVVLIIHEPTMAQTLRQVKAPKVDRDATGTAASVSTTGQIKSLKMQAASAGAASDEAPPPAEGPVYSRVLFGLPLFDRLSVSDASALTASAALAAAAENEGATDTSSISSSLLHVSQVSRHGVGLSSVGGDRHPFHLGSVAEEICSHDFETYPMARRLDRLRPYDLLMPSYRLLHSCGSIRTFAALAPSKHHEALEAFLAKPSQRAPERNALVQSIVQNQRARGKAEDERQDMLRERQSESASSSSSSSSESSLLLAVAPRPQRLSVWLIDSSLVSHQVGTSLSTKSWSAHPHFGQSASMSEREMHANSGGRGREANMRMTPVSAEEEHMLLHGGFQTEDDLPIDFIISNVPHEAIKWTQSKQK